MTTITVVTPWRNHPELRPAYQAALASAAPDEVLIVDDGSEPALDFADLRTESVGFSGACNAGLDAASSQAVLFLNNDIELRRPGWLEPIRAELRYGLLVGAWIRRDPHTIVDGKPIPYLDGWCVAGMREDLLALGGWDSTLDEPSYYGDNILSLRAREAGMKLVEVWVGLHHIGNVTSEDLAADYVQAISERNKARYQTLARELAA